MVDSAFYILKRLVAIVVRGTIIFAIGYILYSLFLKIRDWLYEIENSKYGIIFDGFLCAITILIIIFAIGLFVHYSTQKKLADNPQSEVIRDF